MRVVPVRSPKRNPKRAAYSSRPIRSKSRRKKRKLSCSSTEEHGNSRKRQKCGLDKDYIYKALRDNFQDKPFCQPRSKDGLVIEGNLKWTRGKCPGSGTAEEKATFREYSGQSVSPRLSEVTKCWINGLPEEILLKIFGYLPLGLLLHTVPQICKKWEALALDWTLWKSVEDLTIKNMVISTSKLKTLLRTIPRLKKLELFSRNDTEELLHEVFETHKNLEFLKLDCCCRSTLQMNMSPQTVSSILEFCPKLKTIILTDTYFHSKNFYKCLARKFRSIERINVTCTTKSEMDVFMDSLKYTVSELEFQKVPMMGRAAGKQIYWGPILGLVVRPIPTSPFHQQCIHDNFPNYAF